MKSHISSVTQFHSLKLENMLSKCYRPILILFLITCLMAGCGSPPSPATPTASAAAPPASPTATAAPTARPSPTPFISSYAFPASIDPTQHYLFYLHGKIIEDQGIPAVSPDYGEYEYQAILEKLSSYGFVVISEQRAKNADVIEYAGRVADQVSALLKAGVPAKNIMVVGASKGAWIAIDISHLLENEALNYVILGICNPDVVATFKQDQTYLYGNVLSIYDSADLEYAGSCTDLFAASAANGGLSRHDEIVLNVGTGHGILYQPLDEWVLPTVQWAGKP